MHVYGRERRSWYTHALNADSNCLLLSLHSHCIDQSNYVETYIFKPPRKNKSLAFEFEVTVHWTFWQERYIHNTG